MGKQQAPAPRLGIDFGRVIVGGSGDDDTPFVGEDSMNTLPNPYAFEALLQLVELFDQRVWIVSKAGPAMQRKTLRWLDHWGLFTRTGMTPWSVCFVLERHHKVEVARTLKLTHFVDDSLEVLDPMKYRVKCYLFESEDGPDFVTPVLDWPATLSAVKADVLR